MKFKDGSTENRKTRLRILVKNLVELSKGDDYIFLLNKFNTVMIDGKEYRLKLTIEEN